MAFFMHIYHDEVMGIVKVLNFGMLHNCTWCDMSMDDHEVLLLSNDGEPQQCAWIQYLPTL
jgi:hypothetical protein